MSLSHVLEFVRGVSQLILPNACLVCDVIEGDRRDFRHGLCGECRGAFARDPHQSCPHCAITIGPFTDTTEGCVSCKGKLLGIRSTLRLGAYDGRLREAVLRMKTHQGEGLAEMMGRTLHEVAGDRIKEFGVQVIVPVPLHWRRRLARGYNQAAAIAREVALGLGVEYAPQVMRRNKFTSQHVQPTAAARRENMRGAFVAKDSASLRHRTVLLVDDVMTTGSTVAEAAKSLREAGAKSIVVAVLARR